MYFRAGCCGRGCCCLLPWSLPPLPPPLLPLLGNCCQAFAPARRASLELLYADAIAVQFLQCTGEVLWVWKTVPSNPTRSACL